MKLFNNDKFYVIVDEGGVCPTFVTFGASGGFRKCETLVEASKFKDLANAKSICLNNDTLHVYQVEKVNNTTEKKAFSETWLCSKLEQLAPGEGFEPPTK